MYTVQVEIAVAEFFRPRVNTIVPNVSWGLGIHECDLLVVTKVGHAIEIEIKVSKSDLIADKYKRHHHNSKKIRQLYFAMPRALEPYIHHVPERAGIIIIDEYPHECKAKILRKAKLNTEARKLTSEEILQVARLGTMRIFGLKKRIEILSNRVAHLRRSEEEKGV